MVTIFTRNTLLQGNNTYIYKELKSTRIFPSFKTLDLVAYQSLAAKSNYASIFRKSKIYKGTIGGQLFRRAAKN
jgi:hypothetical protein